MKQLQGDQSGAGKILFIGNTVEFTYDHHLNSKSTTQITKRGIVIRQIRDIRGNRRPTGYWIIKFDGNRGLSKVHESRLKNLTIHNETTNT